MRQKRSILDKKGDKNSGDFYLSYWKMFDICLFGRGMRQVLTIVDGWLASKAKKKWIATVNPEFVMQSTKDEEFKKILQKTDLNVVDGIGLLWAQQMLRPNDQFSIFNFQLLKAIKIGGEILRGKHRDCLVTGVDLMNELCKLAADKKYKVFFLGGWGDRAEKTARNFQFSNPNLQCDWSAGEPDVSNEEVIRQINKFKPDILFVAYGMKKQEEWIDKNLKELDIGVAIGVGRSFDYYSGDLKRAPKGWRKMGLEWMYSLIREPKRLKRQLVLPKFVWKVIRNRG